MVKAKKSSKILEHQIKKPKLPSKEISIYKPFEVAKLTNTDLKVLKRLFDKILTGADKATLIMEKELKLKDLALDMLKLTGNNQEEIMGFEEGMKEWKEKTKELVNEMKEECDVAK